MKKLLISAGAVAALALTSVPAAAATPTNAASASVKARIYHPLKLTNTNNQGVDFGVIVLSGTTFTGESVTMAADGTMPGSDCGTTSGDLTCSGTTSPATFNVVGANGTTVKITTDASVTLTGVTNGGTLTFAPIAPATVAGSLSGTDFTIGGTLSGLANTTQDDTYNGNFNVTADYQ
jgi:hypothetical protein